MRNLKITYDFRNDANGQLWPFFGCSSLNTISCEACVLLAKCEFCVVQQACLCYVSNEHKENVQKDTRLGLDAETRNSIRVKTLINHNLCFKSPIIVSLTLSVLSPYASGT